MKRLLWSFCVWSVLLWAQDSSDDLTAKLTNALKSGNSAEVRALEEKLLSAQTSMSSLLAAGVLLAQYENMPDAAAMFERCSRQYPASFEAKYNLALARIALTQYQGALDALNSITPVTADEKPAVEYLTGKVFLATKHLKEAQRSLASAYAQRPQEENYALDLGLLYIRSSAYVQAIEVLRPSLTLHPKSQDLALELALSNALAGRYSESIEICRELQRNDPTSSIPRLIAAFSYCTEKSYKNCEKEASDGLAGPHPNPYFHYLRARAGWDSGSIDHAQMLQDVTAAIQQMPECDVCLLLRSRMYEASHEDGLAIADLQKAVERDNQDASAWYRLSILYRKQQRPMEASDALRRYRSIHDNGANQEVENFRKQFLDGVSSKTTP
jgi:predicted Zn-dependent protease